MDDIIQFFCFFYYVLFMQYLKEIAYIKNEKGKTYILTKNIHKTKQKKKQGKQQKKKDVTKVLSF